MSGIIKGLSGMTVVRDSISGDFCLSECIESLLAICEEVVVGESDSTDGTREFLDRWADKEPRLRIESYPWPHPKGDSKFFTTWLNWTRERLRLPHFVQLDADEILDDRPACHDRIRRAVERQESLLCTRVNYWRSMRETIPNGHAIGRYVVRVGKSSDWLASDEGHDHGEVPMLTNAVNARDEVFVHHMGFLRKPDAFYRKARVILGAFFNEFDKRLVPLEAESRPVHEIQNCEWTDKLDPYDGYIPDSAQRWASDRGHETPTYVPMTEQEARLRIVIDQYQQGQTFTVAHCGDLGDLIHSLSTLKAISQTTGKPVQIVVLDRNSICKRIIHRLPLIEPLLQSQDYIAGIKELTDEYPHWDAGSFRSEHNAEKSLAWAHWQHYLGQRTLPRILPDFQNPWITNITPDPRGDQRIIINRTDRYQNRHFRWQDIVRHYNTALLFVGTKEEHAAFTSRYGPVEYLPTANLLEVASLIAASPLFIGNQSACFAVAEGMKHRRLLEACLYQPDVMVAKEPNFIACGDGGLDLPPLCGRTALKCPPNITKVDYLKNPHSQPRTGWKLDDMRDVSYSMLKRQVKRKRPQWDDDKIHRAIFDALAEREPSYFANGSQQSELSKFKAALENAL